LVMFVKPDLLSELHSLKKVINPESVRERGEELAELLKDHVPVIYSSADNSAIAYNWKIKFNETGKIPAFYNVLPELNHNEMTGFDVQDANKHLSKQFMFVFLKDTNDHDQIQKRMKVCAQLYTDRGFTVIEQPLTGKTYFERALHSLLMADWAALKTAELYGTEPEQVPMVEEFKKKIA
ncbi:MAG: SIS domain-containing protein, partial [Candidatus Paceibacterota bacterium]